MFALIATLGQVGGVIVDKILLTRRQVAQHVFLPVLFLSLFLFSIILYPFLGHIDKTIFSPYYVVIFILMIVTAIIWNIFYYRGVESEKVQAFELIVMTQPLLTIILAVIFLNERSNIHLVIASLIAALALIASHLNKDHIKFSDGAKGLILAIVFMSIELIFIKILLNVLSPVALYAIRTGILFIFFYFYFRPDILKVGNTNVGLILLTAFFGVVQMIAKFYGFEFYGVIYTSLILILAPLLIYVLSVIMLHERLKPRTVIFGLVILGCIVYATLLGK